MSPNQANGRFKVVVFIIIVLLTCLPLYFVVTAIAGSGSGEMYRCITTDQKGTIVQEQVFNTRFIIFTPTFQYQLFGYETRCSLDNSPEIQPKH